MIFDNKLEWGKHVKHVKATAIKRLNLLKFLRIHQALVLSVIEYEVAAYGSARKSILDKLNSTHHQSLRIPLGLKI
jgi:hypothetical protein